jgi:hypothetical protein
VTFTPASVANGGNVSVNWATSTDTGFATVSGTTLTFQRPGTYLVRRYTQWPSGMAAAGMLSGDIANFPRYMRRLYSWHGKVTTFNGTQVEDHVVRLGRTGTFTMSHYQTSGGAATPDSGGVVLELLSSQV